MASVSNYARALVSAHGSNRTGNTQVCAVCHNPDATDFGQRSDAHRRIATHDKLGANFLAFIQLATVRISLRLIESAP